MKRYLVTEHGVVADGATLVSDTVQRVIDLCAAEGGGEVVFPAGEYVLATVFLKSGVHVVLEEGATLLGSLNFYDYASHEPIDYPAYQDASHTYFHTSMFVGIDCDDIAIRGAGRIDMRSVWDEDNVRDMVHRGAKTVALKNCRHVEISGITIDNTTDLAVYFAGCEDVDVFGVKMRVYIDGISPDNSKNVRIHDCDVESGDDGIVFKSSYTLNRIDACRNITVKNCRVKSRCSAIKLGTETNGGFYDITVEDVEVVDTRITAIAIESVDGAMIDGLTLKNIRIQNAGAPIFIHTGARMRGPAGVPIGHIRNVTLENVTAEGPYRPWEAIEWNYKTFVAGEKVQAPWNGGDQYTSNVCGLAESPLENITLRNVELKVEGGITEWEANVPDNLGKYPEVWVYGKVLPAKGIFFRHVRGLILDNVQVSTYHPDAREDFVFDDVDGLVIQ